MVGTRLVFSWVQTDNRAQATTYGQEGIKEEMYCEVFIEKDSRCDL